MGHKPAGSLSDMEKVSDKQRHKMGSKTLVVGEERLYHHFIKQMPEKIGCMLLFFA